MYPAYTYLIVNLSAIAVPLAFTFHPRLAFHRTWYAFWPACFLTAAFFIAWDVLYTHLGVWGFNPDYLIGINLLNLPIEEWLFFICIPYACTYTYACFRRLIVDAPFTALSRPISIALIVALAGGVLFAQGRLYTTVTFTLTILLLLYHLVVLKPDYLGHFYLAYAVVFAGPFLVVNGILTGSILDRQVVWYNDLENLSFRVLTIPVEDFIYGLLLFLMNVTLYELFISRRARREEPST